MNSNQRAHAKSLIKGRPELGDKTIANLVGQGVGYKAIKIMRASLLDQNKPIGYASAPQEKNNAL